MSKNSDDSTHLVDSIYLAYESMNGGQELGISSSDLVISRSGSQQAYYMRTHASLACCGRNVFNALYM